MFDMCVDHDQKQIRVLSNHNFVCLSELGDNESYVII